MTADTPLPPADVQRPTWFCGICKIAYEHDDASEAIRLGDAHLIEAHGVSEDYLAARRSDVQRPTPPLTEEELAETGELLKRLIAPHNRGFIDRLIADLRAEREENERLRRLLDEAGRRWGFRWQRLKNGSRRIGAKLDTNDTLMPFDPEWVGRAPTTIYAVKYHATDISGTNRTYIFLLGSKDAYDQRIASPEKGQGLRGTVVWEAITPAVKKKKPPQEERLF